MDNALFSSHDTSFLTPAECAQWLAHFDRSELEIEAFRVYLRNQAVASGLPVAMSVLRLFLLDQDAGTAAMIFSIADSHQARHDGLDGMAVRFAPGELRQAMADLVFMANCFTEETIAEDLAAKEAALSTLPPPIPPSTP